MLQSVFTWVVTLKVTSQAKETQPPFLKTKLNNDKGSISGVNCYFRLGSIGYRVAPQGKGTAVIDPVRVSHRKKLTSLPYF